MQDERIRLRIREPSIQGKGVFTLHKIHRNTHVLTFHGERIPNNSNAIQAAHIKHGTDGVGFLFALDSQYVIDGTDVDCKARFLNHCCKVCCNDFYLFFEFDSNSLHLSPTCLASQQKMATKWRFWLLGTSIRMKSSPLTTAAVVEQQPKMDPRVRSASVA